MPLISGIIKRSIRFIRNKYKLQYPSLEIGEKGIFFEKVNR